MTVLVHDYLLVMRGAERTFAAMCDMYPGSPIATLLYDRDVFDERLNGHEVTTSPLQRLGAKQRSFKALLPALPWAAEHLDVSGHDLVISSSSAFAHGVRPDPGAVHVCYCHTPFRYAWYERDNGIAQAPKLARPLVRRTLERTKYWDWAAAQRGTHFVANGRITQARIRRHWGQDAPIVYPPVDVDRFAPDVPEDYFLVVGELVTHKRLDIALTAAEQAGVPIKVVGTGPDEARLRTRYGHHAEFLGRIDDDALATVYARARALIVPNIEEFGITAVEAQAAGRPVIAADGGGARETVVDRKTGLFFPRDDAGALARAMVDPRLLELHAADTIANARRFSPHRFRDALAREVGQAEHRL